MFRVKWSIRNACSAVARILLWTACFDILFKLALIATLDLGEASVADMGGQPETHLSGSLYGTALFSLIQLGLPPPPFDLLLGLVWALGLEWNHRYGDSFRCWVQSLLFCLSTTTLLYIGLTWFAAWNIGAYVRQGALLGYPAVVKTFADPVFRGLLRGIGPSYVFWYCALWGIPLGAFLWFIWRFVVLKRFLGRRQKSGDAPTKAQEGDSAALESRE